MTRHSGFRYTVAVIIGLVFDLSIAMGLRTQLHFSLEASAIIGFFFAVGLNYLLFEFWVFEGRTPSLSLARVAKTYFSAMGALAARVAIIYISGFWIADGTLPDLLRLFAAIAVSFVTNFALLKLVFRPM